MTRTHSAFLAGILIVFVLAVPFVSHAQSADVQALINSLLAQVAALQAQLQALLSGQNTGGGACTFTRDLTFDMSGSDVSCLQQLLARDPSVYPEATVTGYFGNLTRAAVQRYQLKYNVVPPTDPAFGAVEYRTRQDLAVRFRAYPIEQQPTLSITANPTTVSVATSANIVWSSNGMSSCFVSGPAFSYGGTSGSQITPPLYNSATYILSCTRLDGGQESRSVTVNVTQNPTVTLIASPTTVTNGQSSVITWSSQGAASCSVVGPNGWVYTGTNGNQSTGALTITSTYTLTCQRAAGGVDTRTVTVTVDVPSAITFTATPSSVGYGKSATLAWNAQSVTSCSLSGPNSLTASGTSGSITTGNLTADATYTLTCQKTSGSSETRTVTVDVASQVVLTLTAAPALVYSGGVSTVTWSSTNASSCKVNGPGIASDGPTSGSATTGSLTASSTIILDCADQAGIRTDKQVSVGVLTFPDAAADIANDLEAIEDGMRAWAQRVNRTTWWTDASLGTDPTIASLVADTSGLGKHLTRTPTPPTPERGAYRYDNDGNNFACGGSANAGVNIVLENVTPAVLTRVEELIDGDANPLCGRVTYSGTTLFYKLSKVNAFVPDAVLRITANPDDITSGQNSIISWSATNIRSCSVTGRNFSNVVGASGVRSTGTLTSDTRYRLTCIASATGETVSKSVLVEVKALPPTCTLTVNPASASGFRARTLSWTTSRASSGSINQGVGTMSPIASGSRSVSPTQTTVYTATVNGAGGTRTCTATATRN